MTDQEGAASPEEQPGGPEELRQDPLVERLRPDPSEPSQPVRVLVGFSGESDREGHWRLYFTRELDYYIEFRREDVVYSEPIPREQAPHVGLDATRVGITRDATIEYTRVRTPRPVDEFDLERVEGVVSTGPDLDISRLMRPRRRGVQNLNRPPTHASAVPLPERRKLLGPVYLVPYDPAWPSLFAEERTRILKAIGPWVKEIEHIGSTAIPGLDAKPIVDLMVGLRSMRDADLCIKPLDTLGYTYFGLLEPPHCLLFIRFANAERTARTHNLHLVEAGGWYWKDQLLIRDYLRDHPQTALRYARLKHELAVRHRDDPQAYAQAKHHFIENQLKPEINRTPREKHVLKG